MTDERQRQPAGCLAVVLFAVAMLCVLPAVGCKDTGEAERYIQRSEVNHRPTRTTSSDDWIDPISPMAWEEWADRQHEAERRRSFNGAEVSE